MLQKQETYTLGLCVGGLLHWALTTGIPGTQQGYSPWLSEAVSSSSNGQYLLMTQLLTRPW
jgi:hypothetical protein